MKIKKFNIRDHIPKKIKVKEENLSKIQEILIAKKMGGRKHFCSGSLSGQRGDGQFSKFRFEAKRTSKKSFRVTDEMLKKITFEALGYNQIPVIIFELFGLELPVENEWAIVPLSFLEGK